MRHQKGNLRRYSSLLLIFATLFTIGTSVSAEVDSEVLTSILSKLAGDSSTGTTQTNSTNTGTTQTSTTNTGTTTSTADPKIVTEILSKLAGDNATSTTKTTIANSGIVKTSTASTDEVKTPSIKIKKIQTGEKKVTVTFGVTNDNSTIRKFGFTYTNNEGKTQTLVTYAKEEIKNINWDYTWYIPNLSLTKYSISLAGLNESGKKISTVASANFEADLSLRAAGKCIIPEVSDLRVISKPETSVLHWKNIPEAIGYRVYKKDTTGVYSFVAETKKNAYTIYVADGSAKYEQFSVAALCSDGVESLKTPDIRVRTGPSELILLGVLSAFIGGIIARKRKKSLEKVNTDIQ